MLREPKSVARDISLSNPTLELGVPMDTLLLLAYASRSPLPAGKPDSGSFAAAAAAAATDDEPLGRLLEFLLIVDQRLLRVTCLPTIPAMTACC